MTHVTCRLTAKNRDHLRNYARQSSIGYLYLQWQTADIDRQPVMGLLQLRYKHDSSTIRVRFEHDSATTRYEMRTIRVRFERDTTSYEEISRTLLPQSINWWSDGTASGGFRGAESAPSPATPWATARRRHGTPSCQLVLNFDRHAVKHALQNTQNDCHHAVAFSAL